MPRGVVELGGQSGAIRGVCLEQGGGWTREPGFLSQEPTGLGSGGSESLGRAAPWPVRHTHVALPPLGVRPGVHGVRDGQTGAEGGSRGPWQDQRHLSGQGLGWRVCPWD